MKSFVYHFQINVSDKKKSFPFYKDLLSFLDYKVLFEKGVVLGMGNKTTDLWLIQTPTKFKKNKFHRKNTGLNHISFGVETREDVDEFVEKFITPRKIKVLYNSPREFPEYEKGYYAVYFEDPDKMKIEVTWKPGFKNLIGASGSGKSTIDHDIIYSEGQRQLLESISTLAAIF